MARQLRHRGVWQCAILAIASPGNRHRRHAHADFEPGNPAFRRHSLVAFADAEMQGRGAVVGTFFTNVPAFVFLTWYIFRSNLCRKVARGSKRRWQGAWLGEIDSAIGYVRRGTIEGARDNRENISFRCSLMP